MKETFIIRPSRKKFSIELPETVSGTSSPTNIKEKAEEALGAIVEELCKELSKKVQALSFKVIAPRREATVKLSVNIDTTWPSQQFKKFHTERPREVKFGSKYHDLLATGHYKQLRDWEIPSNVMFTRLRAEGLLTPEGKTTALGKDVLTKLAEFKMDDEKFIFKHLLIAKVEHNKPLRALRTLELGRWCSIVPGHPQPQVTITATGVKWLETHIVDNMPIVRAMKDIDYTREAVCYLPLEHLNQFLTHRDPTVRQLAANRVKELEKV